MMRHNHENKNQTLIVCNHITQNGNVIIRSYLVS